MTPPKRRGEGAQGTTRSSAKDVEDVEDLGRSAVSRSGLTGIVEVTKEALASAPPLTKAIVGIAGIGALFSLAAASLLAFQNKSDHAFWTSLSCIGLLIVALGAIVMVLTRQPAHGAQPTSSRADRNLGKMPILSHFLGAVEASQTFDLLIFGFWCPDTEPTDTSKLDHLSVGRLWADPRDSSIKANLVAGDGNAYLDIQFSNSKRSWPANVTIRPGGVQPLRRKAGMNFLRLEAHVPSTRDSTMLKEVAITFRIVDKIGTQWVRRAAPDVYMNEIVPATDANAPWSQISISLTDKKWQVFSAEGNHLYPKASPDIDDIVLALVVELGSDRGSERPGPGVGRIMLRNIRLSES